MSSTFCKNTLKINTLLENTLFEMYFFYLSDHTEISEKNSLWGPVEWVGDQLTGWKGSSQKQN